MTTAGLRTFAEVVEIARLVECDCDELAKSCDKGVKCPQLVGLRRAENTYRAGMTKMIRQIEARAPC